MRTCEQIMKQELFMVPVAELSEHCLIDRCHAIPSIKTRGVSDLVFGGMPFDVKNVAMPDGWTTARIRSAPQAFAEAMIEGADKQRIRKQAQSASDDWTHNRLFIVLDDESRWESDPEGVLDELAICALGCERANDGGRKRSSLLRARCGDRLNCFWESPSESQPRMRPYGPDPWMPGHDELGPVVVGFNGERSSETGR